MIIMSSTEARKNFFKLQKNIEDNEEIRIKFKSGDAVMLNSDDYDNLLETLYVLSDAVVSDQLQNIKNLKVSTYNTLNDLRNEMEA